MKLRHVRRAGLVVAPVACGLLVTACGTEVVKQSSEVALIKKGLAAAHAPAAKKIDCPSDVKAKVGQTMKCHVTFQSGGADFTLKVDKWSGDHGHMTIVAAKKTSS
jgi:hypothetical protein